MELEFHLNRKDFAEFNRLAQARIRRIGKSRFKFMLLDMLVWLFVGIGMMGLVRLRQTMVSDPLPLYLSVFSLGVAILLGVVYLVLKGRHFLRHALDDRGAFLSEQSLLLGEDEIVSRSPHITARLTWDAILDADWSGKLVCLFIDNNQAIVIPKRAFEDEQQMREAVALIKRKLDV